MAAHSQGTRAIPPVLPDQAETGTHQWLRDMAQSINLLSGWVGTATATSWVQRTGDSMSGPLLIRSGAFPATPRTLLEVAGATPAFAISDSSAGTDSKTWDISPGGTTLSFRAVSDTYGAANAFMAVNRTGATIAYTQFPQGGVMVGNPAGGNMGLGTLNAVAVYAMGSLLTSDATLKTDIEPLATACLPLVTAVTPRTFRWLDPDEAALGRHSGFLAQDLAEAEVPGIVVGKPGEGAAVDVGAMLAVLWQAVRELSAKVAMQDDELERLRSRTPEPGP